MANILIIFLPLIFVWVGNIVSVISIENGAFLTEQGIYGFSNNASIYLISQYTLLFLIAYLSTKSLKISPLKISNQYRKSIKNKFLLIGTYSIWLIFVIIILANYGFPFAKWADRYEFWGTIPKYFKTIFYQQWVIIFYAAAFTNVRLASKLLLLTIVLNFIFLEKFSGIILLIMLYLQGIYINGAQIKFNFKHAFYVFSIFALLTITIIYHFERVDGEGIISLVNRIAAQSHLIWGAINYCNTTECSFDFMQFNNRLIDDIIGNTSMLHLAMSEISPQIARERIATGGADFTMGFPSAYIITIGHVATFFLHIGIIISFSIVYKSLTWLHAKNYSLPFILLAKLYIDLVGFYTIGSASVIINLKTFFYITIVLFGCVWRLNWKSQKNS